MQFSFNARAKRNGQMRLEVGSSLDVGSSNRSRSAGRLALPVATPTANLAWSSSDVWAAWMRPTCVAKSTSARTNHSRLPTASSRCAAAGRMMTDADRSIAAIFQSLASAVSVINARLTIKIKLDLSANSIFRIVR